MTLTWTATATDGAARVVISASRAGEQSQEDRDSGHGYFTRFLLDALREKEGGATVRDLFQTVHERTAAAVRARGLVQTPTMRSTPAGLEIVLGAPVAP